MKFRTITATYFSATGTTRNIVHKLASSLAEILHLETKEYDFTLPSNRLTPMVFNASTLLIFATPVYAGRVPNVLMKYLATMQAQGCRAIAVAVYGNRDFDDALMEQIDILKNAGALPIAAGAFIGEHSFSYTLAAGRPDTEDLLKVEEFAKSIADKVLTDNDSQPTVEGVPYPYRPHFQPHDENGRPFDIRKVKPITTDDCIACGRCATLCPMGSIDPSNCKEVVGICIKCGACVKGCPQHAKQFTQPDYLFHKQDVEQKNRRRAEPIFFL